MTNTNNTEQPNDKKLIQQQIQTLNNYLNDLKQEKISIPEIQQHLRGKGQLMDLLTDALQFASSKDRAAELIQEEINVLQKYLNELNKQKY